MKIEIKNDPTSEIDWSKYQQLVIYSPSLNDHKLVLTTKGSPDREDCFCGVNLMDGRYSKAWIKYLFKPFNGEITLKND